MHSVVTYYGPNVSVSSLIQQTLAHLIISWADTDHVSLFLFIRQRDARIARLKISQKLPVKVNLYEHFNEN